MERRRMEDRGKRKKEKKKRRGGEEERNSKLAVDLLHRNRIVMLAALAITHSHLCFKQHYA
ncbi:hypothetical protein YC2023_006334 [Brassica napus]